jgi:single-strand DNA-binding protein
MAGKEGIMTELITIHGGLTSAPELRYSGNGVAIASGTVASTERYQRDGEWRDGKKLYLRWSAFKDLAENIAASALDKGAHVVISGKLHTREWEDRDGGKRSSVELEVTDFAMSLKRATVTVQKIDRREAPVASQDVWNTTEGVSGDDTPF